MISTINTGLSSILRSVSSALQYPVILVLLILAVLVLIQAGSLIAEYFMDHRHLKATLPKVMDNMRSSGDPVTTISNSELLNSQKGALLELAKHPALSEAELTAMATALLEEQENRYMNTIKRTDMIAKLGPMFGLLGTLIPLGPGIIALGQGDTLTLSQSLLTAFDTTVLGLVVAAIAIIISGIRRKWYKRYMDMLRALMESLLEEITE